MNITGEEPRNTETSFVSTWNPLVGAGSVVYTKLRLCEVQFEQLTDQSLPTFQLGLGLVPSAILKIKAIAQIDGWGESVMRKWKWRVSWHFKKYIFFI